MSKQTVGRRLLLGGTIGALAMPHAQADTSFTNFRFPATGAPTPRTMPNRLAEIVNVKDFGAVGDGGANDTAAIQAAFDAAFGSSTTPHGGANRYLNRPVFFPAGNYKVTSTLRLRSVAGGHISSGPSSTTIFYAGGGGVSPYTPLISTNGFSYCRVEGLSLFTSGTDTVCFDLNWDNTGDVALNANTFSDMVCANAITGILIGYNGYMGSEDVFINCTFSNCSHAGLKTFNWNALQQTVIGGGANGCGYGFFAQMGSIPAIIGAGFAENITRDIQLFRRSFRLSLRKCELLRSRGEYIIERLSSHGHFSRHLCRHDG